MKINGRQMTGPQIRTLVIPRESGDIVFRAIAILNSEEFDTQYPRPNPPFILMAGETEPKPNFKDKKFEADLDVWATRKMNYTVVKSLAVTEGLEWDSVNLADIDTYGNYVDDLAKAGFTTQEIRRITGLAIEANSLDQKAIDEATSRFLAGERARQNK